MDELNLSLETLIRQYVMLSDRPSNKEWWTCKCAVCNDYKKRGGFKFEGPQTSYHCFNCGHSATHDPTQYKTLSNEMIQVLECFVVPESEYQQLLFNALQYQHTYGTIKKKKKSEHDPDTKIDPIEFPNWFIPLKDVQDSWADSARTYLLEDRGVDPSSYPFHIMKPERHTIEAFERKWRGRLIIPYFRSNQVLWYQGRDLRKQSKMRYINADTESECILSDYAPLHNRTDMPLFIFEGFFDAHVAGGIAIFGNTFKKGQIKLLQQSARRKVYVPDNTTDAKTASLQAIEQGWEISTPDIGSCKDFNAAVQRYGKLYALKSLYDSICGGKQALIKASTYGRRSSTKPTTTTNRRSH